MMTDFTRRSILKGAVVGALSGFALSCATTPRPVATEVSSKPNKRPNFVLVVTDDQRWDSMSCMGNSILQTPHQDALAADGVLFNNNFCTTPLCLSSRASMLTGLYAGTHHIDWPQFTLEQRFIDQSFYNLLRQAGYRTGFIGKLHLKNTEQMAAISDYWRGCFCPMDYGYYGESDLKWPEIGYPGFHLTEILGHQALEFLVGCEQDQPFCLCLFFKAPHAGDDKSNQYFYDPKYEEKYKDDVIPPAPVSGPEYFEQLPDFIRDSEMRRRWTSRFSTDELYQRHVKSYDRLVQGIDDAVGNVRMALSKLGLADNTVFMYTSDNGVFLGERGLAAKHLLYEEAIRTPLIISDPRTPADLHGQRVDNMALNIDLAPTILELAGLPVPSQMQGRSLVPFLHGQAPADWRTDGFFEHRMEHPDFPKSEGVRNERWTYIRYIQSDPLVEQLFDRQNDPNEVVNLAQAPDHATTLEQMRARWKQYHDQIVIPA